jgi:translation initiation factor 3 subunit A
MACLAVPVPSQHPEFDKFIETDRTPQEKTARLAILLNMQQPPTRQSLLKDAVRFGVVQAATPQLKDLFNFLETDFSPLHLCRRVEKVLKFVEESEDTGPIQQYVNAVKDVTLVRLLKQVSQVYQSICFARLLELAPFANSFYLERIMVDCVRHNDMQIRVDHRTKTVHFGTELAEAQSQNVAEGPHLQDMPSEQIRTQLIMMFEVLDKSLKTIHPDKIKVENSALRFKIVEAFHASKKREHERILGRHKIIEDRKEKLEKMSIQRDAEEQRKIEKQLREQQKQEEERLRLEREERERQREQERFRQIQQQHIQDRLQQIAQTEIGKKFLDKMDEKEIAELDTDQIMAKQVEELEREKKELMTRLKAQEKKVDHVERAKRKEEVPLLKAAFEVDKEYDKVS